MKRKLTLILLVCNVMICLLFTSCKHNHRGLNVYRTTSKDGYCFYNDGLWYLYYMNMSTGQYYYYGSTSVFYAFDNSKTVDWTPSAQNISNYNDVPTEANQAVEQSMNEVSGETVSGANTENTSNGNEMNESSGESIDNNNTSTSESSPDSGSGSDGSGGGD